MVKQWNCVVEQWNSGTVWNNVVEHWNSVEHCGTVRWNSVEQWSSVAKCGGTRADKGSAVKRARPSKKVSCSGLRSN